MATKKSTPGTRSRRNPKAAAPPLGIQFESLRDHIEIQRSRLMDAEAVIDCVIYAMDEDIRLDAPGPSYSNVIRIVRGSLRSTIDQLDSVSVNAAMTQSHADADIYSESVGVAKTTFGKHGGVKEALAAYVH